MVTTDRRNNTTVIIPARGGSKGLTNKNLRLVRGESLIARAVETARKAQSVDLVCVTTDSDAIALEARKYRAQVIIQPDSVSGDDCLSELALFYALTQLRYHPRFFIFMQCTCPLTRPEHLDAAVGYYCATDADTLVTVSESITTPFIWQEEDGIAIPIGHDSSHRLRRQEIERLNYIENGAFYIINTRKFMAIKERFFGKIVMYKMPSDASLDIDTKADLGLASIMLS